MRGAMESIDAVTRAARAGALPDLSQGAEDLEHFLGSRPWLGVRQMAGRTLAVAYRTLESTSATEREMAFAQGVVFALRWLMDSGEALRRQVGGEEEIGLEERVRCVLAGGGRNDPA